MATTIDPGTPNTPDHEIHHGIDNDPNNDATKGAVLGGIGGAVTGAIAGSMTGPVGAIIGAAIGGAAGAAGSGAAVNAVDRVDNDNTITGLNEAGDEARVGLPHTADDGVTPIETTPGVTPIVVPSARTGA